MKLLVALLLAALPVLGQPRARQALTAAQVTGTVERFEKVPSTFVAARSVDVWLPPGYAADRSKRYPVLYVQDGQNLFDPASSYHGVDWGIDETMTRLISDGSVEPAIVVGIWNSPKRSAEYMAQKALSDSAGRDTLLSDRYLEFLVTELKPLIDSAYRTIRKPEATFIMGSSRGALISAYAVCEYPEVFGGAACLSTHWVAWDGAAVSYMKTHLPDPARHKLYFDYGSKSPDSLYEPYQLRLDALLARAGYASGKNWITKKFEGAGHSEKAWRERVDVPLTFFFGKKASLRPKAGPMKE